MDNGSKKKVSDVLKEHAINNNEIKVLDFAKFRVGEGI